MKKIVICPNVYKDVDFSITKNVIKILSGYDCRIYADRQYEYILKDINFADSDLYDNADVAISLGGDGTVLSCISECAKRGIPVLGIDLGKVGYLASLPSDRLDMLGRLFNGDFAVKERMMLRCSAGKSVYYALNDFIIADSNILSMISLDIFKGERELLKYRCTGLIFATATGSTAYNLSAGGSVIEPEMECIAVTPISQHSLNPRSIIFSPETVLTVKSGSTPDKRLYIAVDGVAHSLDGCDSVEIQKAEFSAKLITFGDDEFVKTLLCKLK